MAKGSGTPQLQRKVKIIKAPKNTTFRKAEISRFGKSLKIVTFKKIKRK